ncbi:MAG: hypothetical protein AB1744_13300 [Candidatus Zixiibacteriota bacterium]
MARPVEVAARPGIITITAGDCHQECVVDRGKGEYVPRGYEVGF